MRVNSMIEYQALVARMKNKDAQPMTIPAAPPKENKFHAVLTEAHQIKFPCKKAARFYVEQVCRQNAGEIRFILREVAFDLPGVYEDKQGRKRRARHFVDFGICENDGTMSWHEVKGKDLPQGKLKRVQVEELYGIKINVV